MEGKGERDKKVTQIINHVLRLGEPQYKRWPDEIHPTFQAFTLQDSDRMKAQ